MIISFAYTTPALLAGAKTVTRREWKPKHARSFKAGDLVAAYDRSPRLCGKQVATIQLTAAPSWEPDSATPDTDFEAEGFAFLARLYEAQASYEAWRVKHGRTADEVDRDAFIAAHPELDLAPSKLPDRVTLSRANFDEWRSAGGWSWVIRFQLVGAAVAS